MDRVLQQATNAVEWAQILADRHDQAVVIGYPNPDVGVTYAICDPDDVEQACTHDTMAVVFPKASAAEPERHQEYLDCCICDLANWINDKEAEA